MLYFVISAHFQKNEPPPQYTPRAIKRSHTLSTSSKSAIHHKLQILRPLTFQRDYGELDGIMLQLFHNQPSYTTNDQKDLLSLRQDRTLSLI